MNFKCSVLEPHSAEGPRRRADIPGAATSCTGTVRRHAIVLLDRATLCTGTV